jgi:hypothetical protein
MMSLRSCSSAASSLFRRRASASTSSGNSHGRTTSLTSTRTPASLQSSRSLSSAPKRDDVDDIINGNNPPPPPIKNPFNSDNKFEWQDPLKLTSSSLLTSEELAIQQTAHQFCQSVLQPNIVNAARHEITFNHENMRQLGEMGMLGVTIPEYYDGCAGLGYVAYGLIAAEVERVDSSYRSAMSESLFFFPPLVCHYYLQARSYCSMQ